MALAAARNTNREDGVAFPDKVERAVRNGVTVWKGGMQCADAAGTIVPAGNANGVSQVLGCLQEVPANANSIIGNAAGTNRARLTTGLFWFDNSAGADALTVADLYHECYAVDDEAVARGDNNGAYLKAGIVMDIDATLGVLVALGPYTSLEAGALKRVSRTLTSADLTTAGVGPETETIGAALPVTGLVAFYRIRLVDAFDNGAGVSLAMELGFSTDVDALEDSFDLFTGSAKEAIGWTYTTPGPGIGVPPLDTVTTTQVVATITAGADQLANFTGGDVDIEVFYYDIPSVL
jgi:hypothetical protein